MNRPDRSRGTRPWLGRTLYFLCLAVPPRSLVSCCHRRRAPVIPFLGLELVVVGAVFCRMCQRASRYGARVRATACIIQHRGKSRCRHEFQRCWARVVIEPVRDGWYPPRLIVRSHGRKLRSASFNEDRAELARRLRRVLGPGPCCRNRRLAASNRINQSNYKPENSFMATAVHHDEHPHGSAWLFTTTTRTSARCTWCLPF